jgi:AcrR family transcriptional regulator
VPKPDDDVASSEPAPTLRAEQVAQTRAALVAAGRRLFGERGYANTSVEDLAREARVTTGALYHHFSTKTMLFEAVFEQAHAEIMDVSAQLAEEASDEVDLLVRGFTVFLDAVLKPDLQRILVVDAPAVLGLARFTELDERDAFNVIVLILQAAVDAGRLAIDDPPTMGRLLLSALTRAAILIASSPQPAETRELVGNAMNALLAGLTPRIS